MGCNCGGANFQIDNTTMEAADQQPIVGDASYFWTGQNPSSDNTLVAPDGTPVWNPDTGKTEREA
jgi:hypothetical protein